MVFVILAIALTLACSWLAWSHARRAARIGAEGLQTRSRELARRPLDDRLAWLQEHSAPDRWEHELCRQLAAEPDPQQRLAAVNEVVAALEHVLDASQGWPRWAAWICVAGSVLIAIGGYLVMGLQTVLLWIAPVILGSIGACVAAARHGKRLARSARRDADELVAALVGELAAEDLPQRRQMRWRRRRGRRG